MAQDISSNDVSTQEAMAELDRRLQARLTLLEAQLHAISRIGEEMSAGFGLNSLFKAIVPHTSALMAAERCTLFLYDETTDALWSEVVQGEEFRTIHLPAGFGIAGWVAKHLESLNIHDAYKDHRFNPAVDKRTGFRTTAVAVVPITNRSAKLLGVLQVLNPVHGGVFSPDEVALLESIAAQVSYAVENQHLAQELIDRNEALEEARAHAEGRRAELDLLYDLEQQIATATTASDLAGVVLPGVCLSMRSDAGAIMIEENGDRRVFFANGFNSGSANDAVVFAPETKEITEAASMCARQRGEELFAWICDCQSPVMSNAPVLMPAFNSALSKSIGFPVDAVMGVPLTWEGQQFGTLELLNPTLTSESQTGYTGDDLKLLSVVGAQIARAVGLIRTRAQKAETDRLAALGSMLAGVAHDIRNPMSVISGYAQLLPMEPNADKRDKQSQRILSQMGEMTAMINDVLGFARGDTSLKLEDVSLQKLADDIRESLDAQCTPRRVALSIEASDNTVAMDKAKIKRVLLNLGKNSAEVLTGGAGQLKLTLNAADGGLRAMIEDNGPGIPPEVECRLFKEFVTSGKEGGTGLGLSIVKRFVDDHGGTIEVDTEVGRGTSFIVTIPEQLKA